MPASFLGLPAELRNEIYKYLLLRSEPFHPLCKPSSGKRGLVPNLLSTNTTILREARAVLYGHNCLDFNKPWYPKDVPEFLDSIGLINASHIRCVLIRFPLLRETEGDVSLDEDDLRLLEKVQSHCTHLKTIIADISSTMDVESLLGSFDPAICDKALTLLDAHFRAIPSLPEIVIELPESPQNLEIRRKMQSRGWILKLAIPDLIEEEPIIIDED